MFEMMLMGGGLIPLELPKELGPGPKVLLQGNAKAGYFGVVPGNLLITQSDLNIQHGITAGLGNQNSNWLKFILDGTIYYIAQVCSRISLTANALRSQLTKGGKNIQIGGLTYLHRQIKGDTIDPSNFPSAGYVPNDNSPLGIRANNSEWGRTLLNVCLDPDYAGTGKWAQFTKAQLGMTAYDSNGTCTICYEDSTVTGSVILAGGGLGVIQRNNIIANAAANWFGHRNMLILKQP